MIYYKNLMKQFQESVGMNEKISSVSLDDFMFSFSQWLIERERCGRNYCVFLEENGLITDETLTYEIGKGKEDTVTKSLDTTLITPYPEHLGVDSERIINKCFCVFRDKPTIVNFNLGNIELLTVREDEKITCMTQNPYTKQNIINWERLHNSGNSRIILGMYGNTFDKDRIEKLNQLRRFRNRLIEGTYREEQAIYGDTYCYVIASDEQVKRLVKVKTK